METIIAKLSEVDVGVENLFLCARLCKRTLPSRKWAHSARRAKPGLFIYDCTFRQCNMRCLNFSSLKRHIRKSHPVCGTVSVEFDEEVDVDAFHEQNVEETEQDLPAQSSLTVDEIRCFLKFL